MGALKTAGILSGLGQGLGKGLETMQAGIIQQGLLQERFKHDDAAAAVERDFQTRKLEEQRVYETKAKQVEREFTGGENQKTRDATRDIHVGDRESAAEQTRLKMENDRTLHEGDRAASAEESRKKMQFEGGEKEKDRTLKREELTEYREYHKGLVARATQIKPSLPPEKKAQLDILQNRSKELAHKIEKFSEMGSKAMDEVRADEFYSQAQDAMEEQDRIHEKMEELFKIDLPKAKPSAGSEVKDPFGKSPITKGQ